MKKILTASEVYNKASLNWLTESDTSQIKPLLGDIIEQDRAKEAIRFGLSVDKFGYNIFCSGDSATLKRTYLTKVLSECAKNKPIPDDLCYVNNFEDETHPVLINLPHGKGVEFRDEMNSLIELINTEVKKVLSSGSYKKKKELLFQEFDGTYEQLYAKYDEKLSKIDFTLAEAEKDLVPVPLKDGEQMTREQFDELTEEEASVFLENKKKADIIMVDLIHKIGEIDEEKDSALSELDLKFVSNKVNKPFTQIKKKFSTYNPKISTFIDAVKEDLIGNIPSLKETKGEDGGMMMLMGLGIGSGSSEEFTEKYAVNLIIDNKDLKQAPVIFLDEFDDNKLFGATAFNVSSSNNLVTDYSKIKAGKILEANGGYLVVKVEDLFRYYFMWDKFKHILQSKELQISSKYSRDLLLDKTLIPDPIPVNLKVVLIGDYSWYMILMDNDPEFAELFKIHAIFESATNRTEDVEKQYVQFVAAYCISKQLKPFAKDALEAIIEYSSRLTGMKDKVALNYNNIYKLLDEADVWATSLKKETVDGECIEKALQAQRNRINVYDDYYREYLQKGIYLIDTDGYKVGQINGLAVMNMGDYEVGHPSKVTVATYRGNEGVISVERNVKLSGKIHDKGVEIIRGFLGKTFAQDFPLSLCANISFEQNYGGIDGDSATSTELYAILSDLSDIPINQGIAVTGSMNQRGEVQAIGGVNEKIEGFFEVCKTRGLTGNQGVIIPVSNVGDLMLSKEIREAIEVGKFTIYAVDHIFDGIQILTGSSFDEIKEKVVDRLSYFNKKENQPTADTTFGYIKKKVVGILTHSNKKEN